MRNDKLNVEYDFTLVLDGASELADEMSDRLFEAGCDDATFSVQYGRLCAEFSRRAPSLQKAILSAIKDIKKAKLGLGVARVDQSDLVTQSDIARRIKRTRQQVSQYIAGTRGPGRFPPPDCHLSEHAPLWRWCSVSHWLAENDIIREGELHDAQVIAIMNTLLELQQHCKENPELVNEIKRLVPAELSCI